MKCVDHTGSTFGLLTVIKRAPDLRKGFPRWECKCSCGNIVVFDASTLKRGNTQSCGCLWKNKPTIDLIGQTFGRLTVVKHSSKDKFGKYHWECICSCGNTTIVERGSLKAGNTSSCGCLKKELCVKKNFVHGMAHSPENKIWRGIIKRCTNPNTIGFENYGGRGITICDEWKNDFMAFYNHVGPRPSKHHSIERVNNNRGYEPGNLRWATRYDQNNNSRHNHRVTVRGRTLNLSQWAKVAGIKYCTLKDRVRRGWPYETAIFQPVKH